MSAQCTFVPNATRSSVGDWLIRTAVTTALAAVIAPGAHAQEASSAAVAPGASNEVEEVVVTGSRIARPDYKSDSPMVTIGSDRLQNTADVGIDQQLAKLPQFVSGANQITSAADVQATPTNSPGISTVNLRGLGTNRTLVLMDGRRTQPNNASLVVDLNTIPTSAIDSVEIITGGAGATYGADAVAGVVNFKLKQNYQGITLDASTGQTGKNDGAQTQVSALLGANVADNRGNVMLGLNFSKRDAVYFNDRPFERRAWTDPGTAATSSFPNFAGYSGASSQAALNSVFSGYAPGDVTPAATLYFNPGATTAGASLFSVAPGVVDGARAPGYTGSLYPYNKYLSNGSLGSNLINGFISLPLERYSAFADGHLEINEHATVYAHFNFDQNTTQTQSGQFAPAVLQWAVTVPVDAGHPVPSQLGTLLASRTTPAAPWTLNRELDDLGSQNLTTQTTTYELLAGVRGTLGVKDWTYDSYVSSGTTLTSIDYSGFADLGRYQALINMPNYGAGAVFNNGRTGQLASCTSGVNPFVTTPISQDCRNIIDSGDTTTTRLRQNQVELDIQGGLFPLPAGDLRFAVGADYRKDDYTYRPDAGMSTSNITSLTVGLFDTSSTQGQIGVAEGYLELLAPLLKDLPAVKSFDIDAGYRYSKYDTATGGVNTWKVTANWDINGKIKLRGGRQVANRAPNVAELFQPATYLTVPWPDHDPCSIVTHATYGNVASNPHRAQVQALCTQLSGGYKIDSTFLGNQSVYFPLGRDLQIGNPNLKSEQAGTWTVGAVIQSPFEQAPLKDLNLTVDYYDIVINGAIAPATTETTYQECFNAYGTNPTYSANNEFCKLILRSNVNGFWLATDALYSNLGSIKTSGIDSALDWKMAAPGFGNEPGMVFANINFNYLLAYDVQNVAGGVVLHYANTIGSPITAPPYGAQFRWKLFTTLGYRVGPAALSANWRHMPSVNNVGLATDPTSKALKTASYDEIDMSAVWSVSSTFDIRAGVDNLFDKQPPTVGAIPGSTNSAGVTDIAGSYDVIGRRYYVGFTARL